MSNFLYLFRGDYSEYNQLSEEEKGNLTQEWIVWLERLKEQGKLIEGLPLSQEGKVVRKRGELITNGPFAEGAEVIGGYTIIVAKDMDEAFRLSQNNPHAAFIDASLEIREIVNIDDHS